jgi:hypothetical protein
VRAGGILAFRAWICIGCWSGQLLPKPKAGRIEIKCFNFFYNRCHWHVIAYILTKNIFYRLCKFITIQNPRNKLMHVTIYHKMNQMSRVQLLEAITQLTMHKARIIRRPKTLSRKTCSLLWIYSILFYRIGCMSRP